VVLVSGYPVSIQGSPLLRERRKTLISNHLGHLEDGVELYQAAARLLVEIAGRHHEENRVQLVYILLGG
jgi:hypothetical protein